MGGGSLSALVSAIRGALAILGKAAHRNGRPETAARNGRPEWPPEASVGLGPVGVRRACCRDGHPQNSPRAGTILRANASERSRTEASEPPRARRP